MDVSIGLGWKVDIVAVVVYTGALAATSLLSLFVCCLLGGFSRSCASKSSDALSKTDADSLSSTSSIAMIPNYF